jgi:hypothetical protein
MSGPLVLPFYLGLVTVVTPYRTMLTPIRRPPVSSVSVSVLSPDASTRLRSASDNWPIVRDTTSVSA